MKMLPVTQGVADAETIEFGKRRELKETLRMRYRKANRDDKTVILDEFIAVSGYHRKHAICPDRHCHRLEGVHRVASARTEFSR
jgi:hypothetical protein